MTGPTGLLVPITTPFDDATGDVAPVPLRSNARALLDAGVSGIVVAGSTGEAPLLSEAETRQLVEWLRDVVPPDRCLVAGTGRESTRAAVAACRDAADGGADFALVRTPSYYGPAMTPNAVVDHFRRVADQSPIPVLVYNIPKYTHLAISDSMIAALTEHPNIVGAKDSSGDLKNFAAYREAAPSWALLVGSASHYYAALEMGASGGILAVACYAAAECVSVGAHFTEGDKGAAGAAQEVIGPLGKAIVGALGVAGVKAAMDAVGLVGGPVRSPLTDLPPVEKNRVATSIRAAGLVPA